MGHSGRLPHASGLRRGTPQMRECLCRQKGSGLIIALSVLAMLTIMATTFITLMRLDTRVTRNYVDDQRCEMLALGVLNYTKSLLRDDIDRTWGKYENRDTAVGDHAWAGWTAPPIGYLETRIPGFFENTVGRLVGDDRMGTPPSNDFWFSPPYGTWNGDPANIYGGDPVYSLHQQSFDWQSHYQWEWGCVGRYWDAASNREYDVWLGRTNNWFDSQGRTVSEDHPDAKIPVDDDSDGVANPPYTPYGQLTINENYCIFDYYYDQVPFVIYTGPTFYQPGSRITGEAALPGGIYWRWGLNVGPTQEGYANLNTAGNVDGLNAETPTANRYVSNIGQVGLVARRAYDERTSLVYSEHLGRMEWQGFPGEYEYALTRTDTQSRPCKGFPQRYNNVLYSPAAANLERLFLRHEYSGQVVEAGSAPQANVDRAKARALIRYRWPNNNNVPADGTDRWRVGWRRDGASYYRFPSPENPMGSDRYFGANEVIEHDHSLDHPDSSAVVKTLIQACRDGGMSLQDAIKQADADWRALRPHCNMWSTDTILRGKIWPTEGRLPWRPGGGTVGDWRHIDILKRVNLNIIGASGPEGLPGEDTTLKIRWAAKRAREKDRLYFMLVGGMRFTNTPPSDSDRTHQACQFVASLSDMVDRDQNETYYAAPDGSAAWALGVEKHPVLNEVALYLKKNTNPPNPQGYDMDLRLEFYNPMENIPWIADADEAFDISDYVVMIGSHPYRVGNLNRFGTTPTDDRGLVDASDVNRKIGADGMYAYPQPIGVNAHQTWSRYADVGWRSVLVTGQFGWPLGLTKLEIEGSITISLWKPLSGNIQDGNPSGNVPITAGKVQDITVNALTRRYVCVDAANSVKLTKPYAAGSWPGGTQTEYIGIYRRWDPMNAKVNGTQGTDETSNVLWCAGWDLSNYPTLGRPNADYPLNGYSTTYAQWNKTSRSAYKYQRPFERNFKVVDGDLPSIGWLGELMMKNCAQDGPLTSVHAAAQPPVSASNKINELDTKAKFDLFRPFAPAGKYNPTGPEMNPVNLHMLDIFTVWDPSNDGMDNDGDGAVDDDDTGLQADDKGGPEVRVFGKMDMNLASQVAITVAFPDDEMLRIHGGLTSGWSNFFGEVTCNSRSSGRDSSFTGPFGGWGPFETIGDFIRADKIQAEPAKQVCGSASQWGSGPWRAGTSQLLEVGLYRGDYRLPSDEDGDGITDERDERDMLFTWIANHYTTRSSLFEVDINAEICAPPYYPGRNLPYHAYKTNQAYARKQLTALLDRSTTLRLGPDGRCDFSGPVGVRLLRMTDDLIVY